MLTSFLVGLNVCKKYDCYTQRTWEDSEDIKDRQVWHKIEFDELNILTRCYDATQFET